MNLKEVEYIVTIAEERSVTRAAEKLFITQSALNQQLIRLEKEIGSQLFFRSRAGWTPTEAGEVYLASARELLRIRKETYHRLQDITAAQKGRLSIGLPPERCSSLFAGVYPAFHREYPHISINILEVSVRKQQSMISRGELDIGFMTLLDHQRSEDEYIDIGTEELILAVPVLHPLCREAALSPSGPFPELDIRLLREEPFALPYQESTMREVLDAVFRQAGFAPTVLFDTSRIQTILDMVESNMCCGLFPSSYLAQGRRHVACFHLPERPTWNLTASYRKGSYLGKSARSFISLVSDYWKQIVPAT